MGGTGGSGFSKDGGAGGVLPAGLFVGQILVWDGDEWVVDFVQFFSTQTSWAIDPVAGNDENEGTAASPLATEEEFARRWKHTVFDPAVAAVTVQFAAGAFAGFLELAGAVFTGPCTVTVLGTMTETDSGTVTAIQAWNGNVAGADGQRGQITDAAQDFTASVLRRVRLTASGACSFIASLGGGVTVANTGQFSTPALATANPAIGNAYSIETFATSFPGYSIELAGPVNVRVRDVAFVGAASPLGLCGANVNQQFTQCAFFGCRFDGTSTLQLRGNARFVSCSFEGNALALAFGNVGLLNTCHFGFFQTSGCSLNMQACLFEGGGARNAAIFVSNGTYAECIGGSGNFGLAFYGVVNGTGTSLVTIEDGAQLVLSNAAANFMGATGNTITQACTVRNGCQGSAVTLPKATGATPGADLVLAGAAAIAWAFAVAAPPNTAAFNSRA